MEITNENRKQVLDDLAQRGYTKLVSHIKEYIEINEIEYPEGTEWGSDSGYGVRLFLIDNVSKLAKVKKEYNLMNGIVEHEVIINDGGKMAISSLFLTSSDSGVVLIQIDS